MTSRDAASGGASAHAVLGGLATTILPERPSVSERTTASSTDPGASTVGAPAPARYGAAASRPAGYRPLPGPVDRVTFLAEQERNRRASRVFGAFIALAITVTGIPLGVVAAPLLYVCLMPPGVLMSVLYPHSAWMLLIVAPAVLLPMLVGLALQPSHVTVTDAQGIHALHGVAPAIVATLVFAVLPGALLFTGVWVVVRRVLHRAGSDAILAMLGARAANTADAEERLLVDVVEEIAVAAAVPTPRVAIVDAAPAEDAANAGVIGWSIHDATVVVTRPLLDRLSRDQVQAVVARVIGSIGNGDARIAFLMLSIFQAVRVVQFSLFGVSRARTLRILARCTALALKRRPPATDAERAGARTTATDLLEVGNFHARLDTALQMRGSALGCLLALPLFPLRLAAWTIGFIISGSEYLLTGPLVDAMWRKRELLADATSVQLTRNPDGLAGALERLGAVGTTLPRADTFSYLFAAWWAAKPKPGDPAKPLTLFARKPHATPERRIAQLVAMGAHPEAATRPDVTPTGVLGSAISADALGGAAAQDFISAMVAAALACTVGVMMWLTLWLTGFELFALGFLGLFIVRRAGGG